MQLEAEQEYILNKLQKQVNSSDTQVGCRMGWSGAVALLVCLARNLRE
jgi:hypothetical protein